MRIMIKGHGNTPEVLFQNLLWLVLVGFLLGVFWSKPSIPYFIGEVVGFILILFILSVKQKALPIPKAVSFFILASVCSLSLYLLPLSTELWLQLPGRDFYQPVIQLLGQTGNGMGMHSISLDAYATLQVLLALLPALAVFLSTICLEKQRLYRLTWVFIAAACFQAVWGIFQYSATGVAQGSYSNRNHYAALMGLALPITIGLLVQHITRAKTHDRAHMLGTILYVLATALIFLGGLVSTSRAGTAGLFFGLLASALVFSSKLGRKRMLAGIGFLLLLSMLLSVSVDITPMLNRFIALDPEADPRWVMFNQAIKGIKTFFPLGSGPGTFADVYTAFQPLDKIGWAFLSHAHNDYIELLFETGVLGATIISAFLGIFLYGLLRLWKQRQHDELVYLKTGAAIGIMTALFHTLFDFNFHTRPYPVFFALLAGIFFMETSQPGSSKNPAKPVSL